MTHETSIEHKSATLEVLKKKFLCELERLSFATTFAVWLFMKLDGTDPADMTPIITYVISLTKNMTNAEQEKICWELWLTYREKKPQRQCDRSNTELSQGTKPSEQTPGNSTILM